ncbi:manganese containing catalase [Moorella thermoacetica]|uniref:Manganese containing catalase n=1 Tax=Neomoorella thermoacetica TaxID=1525 RepID=A0A1J5JSX1_NEOTH|nr:manganese containing catalase [Moorella thermoacetica]
MAASLRYLTQRYTMPIPQAKGVITDIGTEELAHMEIVATLVYNLIKDASIEEIKRAGLIQLSDDPDVSDTLKFLREREVVHFQRFGETLNLVHEHLKRKKYY